MNNTYGRQSPLFTTGANVQVTADGKPDWKSCGITIDWNSVAAVGSDTTLPDGLVIKNGQKGLRYGQILTRITEQPSQTVAVGGSPTGGTFPITGTNPITGVTSTQTIPWNATVAQVQTAMDAIFGAGNTLVSGSGALPANLMTITFQGALIDYNIPVMTGATTGLVGGTPTVTVTQVYAGGNDGMFGPYDPAATDGRANLTRGECFILNTSVLQLGLVQGMPAGATSNPGVFDGGRVWKARLLFTTGAASLAAGPTLAAFETAFPRISYVEQ